MPGHIDSPPPAALQDVLRPERAVDFFTDVQRDVERFQGAVDTTLDQLVELRDFTLGQAEPAEPSLEAIATLSPEEVAGLSPEEAVAEIERIVAQVQKLPRLHDVSEPLFALRDTASEVASLDDLEAFVGRVPEAAKLVRQTIEAGTQREAARQKLVALEQKVIDQVLTDTGMATIDELQDAYFEAWTEKDKAREGGRLIRRRNRDEIRSTQATFERLAEATQLLQQIMPSIDLPSEDRVLFSPNDRSRESLERLIEAAEMAIARTVWVDKADILPELKGEAGSRLIHDVMASIIRVELRHRNIEHVESTLLETVIGKAVESRWYDSWDPDARERLKEALALLPDDEARGALKAALGKAENLRVPDMIMTADDVRLARIRDVAQETSARFATELREVASHPGGSLRMTSEHLLGATIVRPGWQTALTAVLAETVSPERLTEIEHATAEMVIREAGGADYRSNPAVERLAEIPVAEVVPYLVAEAAMRDAKPFERFVAEHRESFPEGSPVRTFIDAVAAVPRDELPNALQPAVERHALEMLEGPVTDRNFVMARLRGFRNLDEWPCRLLLATAELTERPLPISTVDLIREHGRGNPELTVRYLEHGEGATGGLRQALVELGVESWSTQLDSLVDGLPEQSELFDRTGRAMARLEGLDPEQVAEAGIRLRRLAEVGGVNVFNGISPLEPQIHTLTEREFAHGIDAMLDALSDEEGAGLALLAQGAERREFIRYAMEHADKIPELLRVLGNHELMRLMEEGGPLRTNSLNVVRDLLSNGAPERRAEEILAIFTQPEPYWKQLFLFTETRLGTALAVANSSVELQQLPKPLARPGERLESFSQVQDFRVRELPEPRLFGELSGTEKKIVFAYFLERTIEISRDVASRERADARNREGVGDLALHPGMYVHGAAIDSLEEVLLNGNLCGEALGAEATHDSYPFHVDLTLLQSEFLDDHLGTRQQLQQSLSGGYGQWGARGAAGQMFLIYRSDLEVEGTRPVPVALRSHHALALTGIPSTEVSGIVLADPEQTLADATRSVVDAGFYVPLYDLDGKLLLTPETFDALRVDGNLAVPVEVWDQSLKTGEQRGSNEGGEYTIPTAEGPRRYYVKFATPERAEHMWSEQLADDLYRAAGVAVPDTRVVRVEGSYGHASEILPVEQEGPGADLKDGFVMDALLGNWDIVYNSANTARVAGRTVRLDNGGSLFFRARGERKDDAAFSTEVRELAFGADRERLGGGMRQMYPELSDADVKRQAEVLKERLTDEVIDRTVDSVRLPEAERSRLKETLKRRRDYILEQVLGAPATS